MAESSKTRFTGLTLAAAIVATSLTTGFIAYFSGDVKIVGSITTTVTQSGAKLTATPTTGTTALVIYGGAKGSHLCIWDNDGAAFSAFGALNGALVGRVASAGDCP